MKRNYTRMLCEGAVCVALAQILGYIKLWKMPWGGSVTLIMLPIFIFAIRWGLSSGLIAGFVLGVLQFMFDGGFVLGWQSILGDYVIAYTLVGLAGIFAGKSGGIFAGAVAGAVGRLISLYITGATLWAEYMPDVFLGMAMTSPWVYSLIYNAIYVGLSLVAALIVIGALYRPLKKYFEKQN